MILSPVAIILLFLFGVFIVVLFVIRITFPKKFKIEDEDKRILFAKIINLLLVINLGIGVLIILIALVAGVRTNDPNGDVTNWVALIVEIGIGIAIGISIYLYSNFQQDKIRHLVTKIHGLTAKLDKIIDEQNSLQTSRKKFLHESLYGNLISVLTSAYNISKDEIMRKFVLPDGTKIAEVNEYVLLDQMLVVLKQQMQQFNDIMEPELYASLSTVCNLISGKGMGEPYARGLIQQTKRGLKAIDTSLFSLENIGNKEILDKV